MPSYSTNLRCGHAGLFTQSLNCDLTPTQVFPPTQLRILFCLPPPHEALQELQLPQELHDAETIKREVEGGGLGILI